MSPRKRVSGPGRKVSSGHLRVDTARAVMKLREYQLAEPESWVLEVLRAGVTLGATRLSVEGDASQIVIAWDGGLLDDETMRSVLDELVNPGEPRREGAIRRLATGLNTALGLAPRRVDLVRTDASGERTRVRYTGDLLEPPQGDQGSADRLAALVAERISPAVAGAPASMHVRFSRRPGLHTFRRFLGHAEPDELRLVRECADDIAIPLHIGGDVLHRDSSPYDLVRVPLSGGLDGFVALVDADSIPAGNHPAWVDFAERGVILARDTFPLPKAWRDPRVSVPLRVFLDRQTLPTNASRSAVRMDSGLRTALDVAARCVPRLLEETHRLLQGDAGEGAWQPTPADADAGRSANHRLRKSVLHLIAAYVRGGPWRFAAATMPKALEPLMSLPLLRDALGQPASVVDFAEADGLVYRGQQPLAPEAYGDSLPRIPFIPPGDAAAVLLVEGAYDPKRVLRLLEQAEEEGRARAVFLRQATVNASIPPSDRDAWVVVPVDATAPGSVVGPEPAPSPDVRGELALYGTSGTPRGRVTLLYQDRPLEALLVPAPCSFAAVVSCPRLNPRPDYRGAESDAVLAEVLSAVERALFVAAEVAAASALGEPLHVDGARMPGRAAGPSGLDAERSRTLLGAYSGAWSRGGSAAARVRSSRLSRVPLVPVLHPDGVVRQEAPREVLARARETKAMLYRVARQRTPPAAHPLALVDLDMATTLGAMANVRCARLDPVTHARGWLRSVDADVVLRVASEGLVGEIGWGVDAPAWVVFHGGAEVERSKVDELFLESLVHVDDARVIVDSASGKVVARPSYQDLLHDWEKALVTALVAAARGAPPATLRVRRRSDAVRQLCRVMATAPRPFRAHFASVYPDLGSTLELPTARGRSVSLGALRKQTKVWTLPPGARIDFDHPDFDPVVVDATWSNWLKVLLGKEPSDGSAVQHDYARWAGGAARRERVMAQKPLPRAESQPHDPYTRAVRRRDFTGVLSGNVTPPAQLTITVEGRLLVKLAPPGGLPFTGQLDVPAALVDGAWDTLSEAAHASLGALLRDELQELLITLARETPRELLSPRGEALLAAWETSRTKGKGDARVREALSHARAWRSVQGDAVSLLDAKRRGRIQVATFEGSWLGHAKGERKAQADHPVIAASPPLNRSALARFIELVDVGELADATATVQQLQARRRVERGHTKRPSLGHPDAVSIATLLADDTKLMAALGPGDARLVLDAQGSSPSTAQLYVNGERVASQALAVFPPVELAFEASGYVASSGGARMDTRQVTILAQRVQRLARRLVTHAFQQPTPSAALRASARHAWLVQGALDDALMKDLAVFETTSGEWVSLVGLETAARTFGAQWYTTDLACTIIPAKSARSVLRLPGREVSALAKRLSLEDASEKLATQVERLRNLSRPKATRLDARELLSKLTGHPSAATLAYAELARAEGSSARGSLVLLTPKHASLAGIHVHHAMHPLGVLPCPSEWPALFVVDSDQLTPNARYDAPKHDARFRALLAEVTASAHAALSARFPAGEFGTRRIEARLASGTLGYGVAALANPLAEGELRVAERPQQRAREFPLEGELWVCQGPNARGARSEVTTSEVRHIVGNVYRTLLGDVADALSERAPADGARAPAWALSPDSWSAGETELAHAHLMVGALRGLLVDHPVLDQLRLNCTAPQPLTLGEARAAFLGTRAVAFVHPDSPAAQEATTPVVLADGSLVSLTLAHELGARAKWIAPDAPRGEDEGLLSKAPASGKNAPPQGPVAALVSAVRELLAAVPATSAGPVRVTLQLSPRRLRPMFVFDAATRRATFAGEDPTLLALGAALESDDPRGMHGAIALAAHIFALVDHESPRGHRTEHLAALEDWLAPL